MTDDEAEIQVRRIQKLKDRWHACLGMNHWFVNYEYERDPAPASPDMGEKWQTDATCLAHWEYRTAKITWYLQSIEHCDDERLEQEFIHEVMHIHLNELRVTTMEEAALQYKHEESVAQALAYAFLWTRQEGVDDTRITYDGYEG